MGTFSHSFNYPSKRQMCISQLSKTLLQKLDGYKSPIVVDVKSSVTFEGFFGSLLVTTYLLLVEIDGHIPWSTTVQIS